MQTFVDINDVVTSSEREKQIVIESLFERIAVWPFVLIRRAISRRNVVVFTKIKMAFFVHRFVVNRFVKAICPHSPLTVVARRHIRF